MRNNRKLMEHLTPYFGIDFRNMAFFCSVEFVLYRSVINMGSVLFPLISYEQFTCY